MSNERILVIGGNGSGKTTFSIALAEKLNLPLVHLDRLGWRGDWEMVPREEFDVLLAEELKKPQWIIDGSYSRTLPGRLKYCDAVIYFDFSTARCLYGVLSRIVKNRGKSRSDMGGNCPEKLDMTFLKNVTTFNQKNRRKYYRLIEEAEVKEVIVFKNRRQAKRYLSKI